MIIDIENIVKNCLTCLDFQPKKRVIHHKIPGKPWKVFSTDIFSLYNKQNLCIIDNNSQFQIIKNTEDFQQTA